MVRLIREEREAKGLYQSDVAVALGEHQSFIARVESGQRRIDVIEFFRIADAIGFDPIKALRKVRDAGTT